MWVLAPLPVPPKAKDAASQAQEPLNCPWVLTGCGRITIGRPSQKGGNEGKADLIAKGDTSVSSIHAIFEISAKNGDRPVITLTDSSKFGTMVNTQKLDRAQAFSLKDNDHIRFGYKSKFQLRWLPVELHSPLPLPDLPAADLAAKAARCGTSIGPWSPNTTHCLAADGQPVSAAVICALIQGIKVVKVSWLDAILAKQAWPAGLPAEADHAVQYVTFHGDQQLQLASWDPNLSEVGSLLSSYALVVNPAEGALLELGALLGAALQPWLADGGDVPAAPVGRQQLHVQTGPAIQEQQQQQLVGMPYVDVNTFLEAVVLKDASLLQAVMDTHKQQQAAAAADDGDMTDATDVSDIEEYHEEAAEAQEQIPLQSLMPLASQRRIQLPAPQEPVSGAAAGNGAVEGRQQQQQQTAVAVQSAGGRRGKAGTPARGTKRTAAAAAAGAAGDYDPLPAKRRRAATGGAAAGSAAAELDGPQASTPGSREHQPGSTGPPVGVAAAAVAAAPGVRPVAPPAGPSTGQGPMPAAFATAPGAAGASIFAADQQGVMLVPLVMEKQQQHPQQHWQGSRPGQEHGVAVVNFKAFRRKGQLDQQQPGVTAPAAGLVVELTSFAAENSGPDAEAFLREEEQRLKRMQKADELFNATMVGATKSSRSRRS